MKKRSFILIFLVIASLSSGCGDGKSKTLAEVDGKVVTIRDFEKRLSKLPPYYRNVASQRKRDFLEDLIAEQLLYEEALRRGMDRDAEVKELISEAKKKILVAKLMEIELKDRYSVDETQIKAYYEAHKDEFVTPVKLRVSHILVDTEAQAQEILQKLKEGADLAQMAAQYSKDPSKDKGGDLGYFIKGQLIPEFEGACFGLEVGQVSGVVKTQFGYHIIKLTERKESQAMEYSGVKDEIEKELTGQAEREGFEGLVKRLRSKAHIKVNEELLKGAQAAPMKEGQEAQQ